MKISSISIQNFRSIHDEVTIPIQKIGGGICYMLLGINESGKSTILDGISLLDGQEELDYESDCNKAAQDEDERIEITYRLDIGDGSKYKNFLIENGFDTDLVNKIKFTDIHRKILVEKGEDRSDEYHIWIKDDKLFEKFVFVKNEQGNKDIELRTPENEKLASDGSTIANLVTKNSLESYLQGELFDILEEDLPEVIFWKPLEDKYLINKTIDLIPLKTTLIFLYLLEIVSVSLVSQHQKK
jgi:predicted ATP-dependent endonuclease of OLD family